MDPVELLDLFERTASEVRTALAGVGDLRARGERPGQYGLDLVADPIVVSALVDAGLGVLSEESGLHSAEREVVVVVDPVDGSSNCSRGIPWYASSFAAVRGDEVIASLVENLASGVTYRAVRGRGATRDGEPISVSACDNLSGAMVALNGWAPRHFGWRQYRSLGATALDLCLVADGSLDAYLDCVDQNHPWDYLGAMLIIGEAGGVIDDLVGRPLVDLAGSVVRSPLAAGTAALADELRRKAVDAGLAVGAGMES